MEKISVWRAWGIIAPKSGRSSRVWCIFSLWMKMSRNESCMSGATHRLPQELSKWLFKRDIIAFLFNWALTCYKKVAYQGFLFFYFFVKRVFREALLNEAAIVTLNVISWDHIITPVIRYWQWHSFHVRCYFFRYNVYNWIKKYITRDDDSS